MFVCTQEVDGIFSADPSKVKTAKVLPRISPGEAAELTFYGSEVIHPFTMEQVVRGGIPIRIKNTFRPHLPGTVIDPNAFEPISKRGAVAVTVKDNVTVVILRSNRKLGSIGFLASVFSIMAKYGLEIDLVSTSEVSYPARFSLFGWILRHNESTVRLHSLFQPCRWTSQ